MGVLLAHFTGILDSVGFLPGERTITELYIYLTDSFSGQAAVTGAQVGSSLTTFTEHPVWLKDLPSPTVEWKRLITNARTFTRSR